MKRKYFILIYLIVLIYKKRIVGGSSSSIIKCPGLSLESRWGVHVDCILTTRGVQNFNCSSPMPPETVALYNCQRNFKQIYSSSPIKLMRCSNTGEWTRMEHFHNLKCEYECGKAQPLTKTLIINDRITTRQIWPWHALIYYKLDPWEDYSIPQEEDSQLIINELHNTNVPLNNTRSKRLINNNNYYHAYICGGTLISPSKILTAAHCLWDAASGLPKDAKDFTVILGGISNSFYTNRQDSSSQIIQVEKLYISKSFDYSKFEGDIGIISLKNAAKMSNVVLPVCLPDKEDSRRFISSRKYGEVIGSKPEVGRTSLGQIGLGLSTQLKSKKLHVLPTIECSRNIDRFPSDKEYCAGMSDEVICSGDSGGGMISSPNFGLKRRYTIQGIVSYARARQLCENYAVFTRVYKFMDWISSVINGDFDKLDE